MTVTGFRSAIYACACAWAMVGNWSLNSITLSLCVHLYIILCALATNDDKVRRNFIAMCVHVRVRVHGLWLVIGR